MFFLQRLVLHKEGVQPPADSLNCLFEFCLGVGGSIFCGAAVLEAVGLESVSLLSCSCSRHKVGEGGVIVRGICQSCGERKCKQPLRCPAWSFQSEHLGVLMESAY